MKKNYSQISFLNSKQTITCSLAKQVLFVALFFSGMFHGLLAQVTVSAPTIGLTSCNAFPTSSATLGDVIISESAAGDISGSGTLILSAPNNFEFTAPGVVSVSGSEISGASVVLTNATTLTLAFIVNGTAELNNLTLSGIKVRGIVAATTQSDVTRSGGTAIISGDINGTVHATLSSSFGIPVVNALNASNFSCSSFNANWNFSPGATNYFIDLSTSSNFVTFVAGYNNLSLGNVNTYNILGISPSSTYYYRIRATSSCGTSTNSNVIMVGPGPNPAPQALAANNFTCTSFNANWNAVPGATEYFLDVSSNSYFTSFVTGYNNTNVGNVTTYNISSLIANVGYYYRIRASNGCLASANSNVIYAITSAPVAPVLIQPSNPSCTSFDANWNSATGATHYFIDVSTSSSFSTFIAGYNNFNAGNTTTFSVSGLAANSTYFYRIRAANGCSTSLNSTVSTFNTGAIGTPVALNPSNFSCTSFDANWAAVSGATNYYIDVSTSATFAPNNFLSGYNNYPAGNVTSINVVGISPGSNYYYRVRASSSCGATSLNSNIINAVSGAINSPNLNAPTNISCSGFNLNWSFVPNATEYYLDISTDATFGTFVSGYNNNNVGNVNSYNVAGLIDGLTYYFRIRAGNGCSSSLNSNVYSATTNPSPAPVAASADNVSCNSFNANWGASAGATAYLIDISTDASFSSFVGGFLNLNVGNVTSYTVTGISQNLTYYYRVRAISSCGTSSNSNTISVSVFVQAPVLSQTSNITCGSFDINWLPVNGASNYLLDVSSSTTFSTLLDGYSNTGVGNVTSYSVTGLISGLTYYYRVRSQNGCGTSLNSSTGTISLNAAMLAPIATGASNVSCTSLNANWSSVPGAYNYFIDVSTSSSFATYFTGYNNMNTGNVTTINITGLTLGNTYFYRVRAYGSCGYSSNSNVINVSTTSIGSLSPVTAAISCNSFIANWSRATNANNYMLDVSTDAGFSGGSILAGYNNLNVNNDTSIVVNGLIPGTTYYYRVMASNYCISGSYSNTITVALNPSALSAPTVSNASAVTCNSFTANWQTVTYALGYLLDVSTNSAYTDFVPGYSNLQVGNVNNFLVSGLTSGIMYYYRIKAFNSCLTSSPSSSISVVASLPTLNSTLSPPSVCSGTSFNYNPTSAAPGATFAWVRNTVSNINNAAANGSGNPNEVLTNITTATPVNVTYEYTVTANGCTNPTVYSVVVTVNPTPVLVSTLNASPICSGVGFSYSPASLTSGATFSWTRPTIAGIANAAASGTGNPSELLVNMTAAPVNVTYIYTLSANGCTNTAGESVVVTVNPIPTLTSTLNPPDIFTNHPFNYNPTSGTTGATFSWTRAVVNGISNAAANGTNDPNETLTDTSSNAVAVSYVYVLSANGCSNTPGDTVVVIVNTQAVWPGDANNDSLVNNIDLLSVGLHYAATGTPRSTIDNTWQANIAANWGTQQTNGSDVKHADCNGDGVINSADTLAINLNFNLTHAIIPLPNGSYTIERATNDMYFVINGSAFTAGDWVDVEVWLGSQITPILGIYGIAFNINYDGSLTQTGTESISYSSSWIGTSGTDAITISKADPLANTAYGAISRTDHMGMNGYGKIADFKFQVANNLSQDDTMMFAISSYLAIDSTGISRTLVTGTDSIAVSPLTTGIKQATSNNKVKIAPNPFNTSAVISLSSEITNGTVKVYDVLGREVRSQSFSGTYFTIEKGDLNPGVYSVKISSESKAVIANEKVIIQ